MREIYSSNLIIIKFARRKKKEKVKFRKRNSVSRLESSRERWLYRESRFSREAKETNEREGKMAAAKVANRLVCLSRFS